MNDEELTKLAVEQLIAEGKKFVRRRELRYTFDEPSRLKPNLKYFKNTLKHCISSNNRLERAKQLESAKRRSANEGKKSNEEKKRKCKNPELSEHPIYKKETVKTATSTNKQTDQQKSSTSRSDRSDKHENHANKSTKNTSKMERKKPVERS